MKERVLCMFAALLFVIGCSFNPGDGKSVSAAKEDLLLMNAQTTEKLQEKAYNDALSAMSGYFAVESKTDKELSESYESLTEIQKLELGEKIGKIILDFEAQRPEPVQDVFDGNPPSGMKETSDAVLIGGDIVYEKNSPGCANDIYKLVKASKGEQPPLNKGFHTWFTSLWTFGQVTYRLENSLSNSEKNQIRGCMREWETASNNSIKFIENPNNLVYQLLWAVGSNHVKIYKTKMAQPDPGVSYVGESTLGKVPYSRICYDTGLTLTRDTILHELGHSIGLHHEHQRWDRDNYIRVRPQFESNYWFSKVWDIAPDTSITMINKLKLANFPEYDYMSIMHYSGGFFTDLNGNPITAGGYVISPSDAKFVDYLY